MWQDFVMGGMSVLLSLAAYRQVAHGFKCKSQSITRYTATSTMLCLFGYAFVYSTLGCVFAALVSVVSGVGWVILLFQSVKYGCADKIKKVVINDMKVTGVSLVLDSSPAEYVDKKGE